jgi:hypothetical protein
VKSGAGLKPAPRQSLFLLAFLIRGVASNYIDAFRVGAEDVSPIRGLPLHVDARDLAIVRRHDHPEELKGHLFR